MGFAVPSLEPDTLTAGDLWTWTLSLPDYPPADGWILTYYVAGNGNDTRTLTATTSGSDFLISVATATTAAVPPGLWFWQRRVSKGSEAYTIGSGRFTVLPNLATSTADPRSRTKRILDLLDANMETAAIQGELSITVDGVALSYRSFDEVIRARARLDVQYQRELAAERAARGLGNRNTIHTRFNRPT